MGRQPLDVDVYDEDRLWLWVDDAAPRVLDRPDTGVVPDGYTGTLGPARRVTESPAFLAPSYPQTQALARSGSGQARFVFTNHRTNATEPLAGVTVRSSSSDGQSLVTTTGTPLSSARTGLQE